MSTNYVVFYYVIIQLRCIIVPACIPRALQVLSPTSTELATSYLSNTLPTIVAFFKFQHQVLKVRLSKIIKRLNVTCLCCPNNSHCIADKDT